MYFNAFWIGIFCSFAKQKMQFPPVVTSNISSMPEVAGQGAIFVDVSSADQIAEALDKISSDKYLRRDIIDKGTDNSRRFSWEHCAQNTLQILTQI